MAAFFGILVFMSGCAGTNITPSLQLVTENYPPITFMKDGKVTGFATEVVQEILKRLNQPDNIKMMAWDDAYNLALEEKNVLLFSTTRTEKREMLFKWVGPIGSYHDVLYARSGSGIVINNLEDAKKLVEGKVDLCAFTDTTAPEILKEAGYSMDEIIPAYVIKTYEYYIAFSKDTSDEIVNDWRRSFEEMKTDGTFDKISKKWISSGASVTQ
ncbi:MAG: transporter substrate-binding domain-containing protein [Coprothermobacterota bacterium]|nr:transporter substrate-binding domain-containing protein [Coprothermobacterota bacterium]